MVASDDDVGVPGGHHADHLFGLHLVTGGEVADLAEVHVQVLGIATCGGVPLAVVNAFDE